MIVILITNFWNVKLAISVHKVYLIRKKLLQKAKDNKLEDKSSAAEFGDISL